MTACLQRGRSLVKAAEGPRVPYVDLDQGDDRFRRKGALLPRVAVDAVSATDAV